MEKWAWLHKWNCFGDIVWGREWGWPALQHTRWSCTSIRPSHKGTTSFPSYSISDPVPTHTPEKNQQRMTQESPLTPKREKWVKLQILPWPVLAPGSHLVNELKNIFVCVSLSLQFFHNKSFLKYPRGYKHVCVITITIKKWMGTSMKNNKSNIY